MQEEIIFNIDVMLPLYRRSLFMFSSRSSDLRNRLCLYWSTASSLCKV